MNYSVADFMIRLKNASAANRKQVVLPYSNINKAIAKTLVKEGFLAEIKEETIEGKKKLIVELRYQNRKPVLTDVTIISKPSLRVYIDHAEVRKTAGRDAMVTVLSTNNGVVSGKEAAKKGVGGELLFRVW